MAFGIFEWKAITRVMSTEQRARTMPRRQMPGSRVHRSRRSRKRDPVPARSGSGSTRSFPVSAPYACTIALSSLPCRACRRALDPRRCVAGFLPSTTAVLSRGRRAGSGGFRPRGVRRGL